MFYTAEQVAESFGEAWTVRVAETRSRRSSDPDGKPVTYGDTVLLAVRARGGAAG